MDGEELVVSLGRNEIALRGEQFRPHERSRNTGDGEKKTIVQR